MIAICAAIVAAAPIVSRSGEGATIFGRMPSAAKGKAPVVVTARSGMRAMRAMRGNSISVESSSRKRLAPEMAARGSHAESLAIGTSASISTRLRPGRMAPSGNGMGFFVKTSPAAFGNFMLTALRPFTLTTICASVVRPGA